MQKGERIKFKGTATDFEQELESMRFSLAPSVSGADHS